MKAWIIYEMQTDKDGNVGLLPGIVKKTELEAQSEFYLKCGYAAVSSVYLHTVFFVTNDGKLVDKKVFMHGKEPEPEPQPQPEVPNTDLP